MNGRYGFLSPPSGLDKSVDAEKKERQEVTGEGGEVTGEGKEETGEEGEEGEEGIDGEKKKDDRDIFELIREEVENEKATLAEMGEQEADIDGKVSYLRGGEGEGEGEGEEEGRLGKESEKV